MFGVWHVSARGTAIELSVVMDDFRRQRAALRSLERDAAKTVAELLYLRDYTVAKHKPSEFRTSVDRDDSKHATIRVEIPDKIYRNDLDDFLIDVLAEHVSKRMKTLKSRDGSVDDLLQAAEELLND